MFVGISCMCVFDVLAMGLVLMLHFTPPEPADINSPEVAKTPGGSGSGKDENVVNGHKEGDANPFAEYMWMENEEEYNRQVSVSLLYVYF